MAVGRHTTGSFPRTLQLGLDKLIDHDSKALPVKYTELFETVPMKKAFIEAMMPTGMGLALPRGEGEELTMESMRQHWQFQYAAVTYEKSCRMTMEAIDDDQYIDLIPMYAKQISKSLMRAKDINCANILNNGFSSTATPLAETLFKTTHALPDGTTLANRPTSELDLSEDAIEQMVRLVDKFKNNDGLKSLYEADALVIPLDLKYEAARILKNVDRPGTAERDINALYLLKDVKRIVVWKELTDTDAWFITTNADNGFFLGQKMEPTSYTTTKDNRDVIYSRMERYVPGFWDFRCAVGTSGA